LRVGILRRECQRLRERQGGAGVVGVVELQNAELEKKRRVVRVESGGGVTESMALFNLLVHFDLRQQ